ncbi:hypothetical protein FISHEDRAFT_53581 [Fistulina hepatica ATCC 64428]|nr:hypothetical protein FISHEDRAFT_53581 [Fistulina hepatica ATCC 64428]
MNLINANKDLPDAPAVLEAGEGILRSVSSWKQGKTYHKTVKTYFNRQPYASENKDNKSAKLPPWFCRISEHDDVKFDEMWEKLGKNKAENEKAFIPAIQKVTKVKEISSTQEIWTLHYKFPFPVSPRVFTVLQVVNLDESARTGTIVSLPVDLSADAELKAKEEKGVRGRYVSVERLVEKENGHVEWMMATSSNSGGLIPTWLANSSVPGQIADDVPHFLEYLRESKNIQRALELSSS